MQESMKPSALAKHLFRIYHDYRLENLAPHNCTHGEITPLLHDLVARSDNLMKMKELGRSIEGRSINMVSCGSGTTRVLLWSQMHGDEPTATLALMDIFNFLVHHHRGEKWIPEVLAGCTLFFIPMLNPDGAEHLQRHTAVGIDMNRDAATLATPEARILRDAHRRLAPSFGFNLHDQELSSVGASKNVTALALLAPAVDDRKSNPRVRRRAMRVAALMAQSLKQFAEEHLAQYDDAYEPRAFGDRMQSWGTSTVLIESGHWPKDPQKAFIRKLNFIALLSAIRAISNGSYDDAELDWYTSLPQNGKKMYDVIIRNVLLQHSTSWSHRIDIGLGRPQSFERISESTMVTIKEIGDLSTSDGLEVIAGSGRRISPAILRVEKVLPLKDLLDALQLYFSPV